MNNKAFTLIELLVVVLIIGILAAIAVPKYQKAVMKADLHRGISLVESLYQAQQSYYLQHGDFTWDLDELDVSFPKDASCVRGESVNRESWYDCDYGRIWNNKFAVQFQDKPFREGLSKANINYTYFFKDSGDFKAGKRYCYARPYNQLTKDVCVEMGGKPVSEPGSKWAYYELP